MEIFGQLDGVEISSEELTEVGVARVGHGNSKPVD